MEYWSDRRSSRGGCKELKTHAVPSEYTSAQRRRLLSFQVEEDGRLIRKLAWLATSKSHQAPHLSLVNKGRRRTKAVRLGTRLLAMARCGYQEVSVTVTILLYWARSRSRRFPCTQTFLMQGTAQSLNAHLLLPRARTYGDGTANLTEC